jgi:hypothetical protein
MTILLRDELLFRRIYSGLFRIVIPTVAQRSGGTCGLPLTQSNVSQETPRIKNPLRIKLPFYLSHQR